METDLNKEKAPLTNTSGKYKRSKMENTKRSDKMANFEGMQNQTSLIFTIALNRVLTLPFDSTRQELPESSGIIAKGLICVELRPFCCGKRILVPMSYISFWEHTRPLNHSRGH